MTQLFPQKFISTKEASDSSGYNADYLSRLCRSGQIVGQRVGRTWLVDRNSLAQFVLEQSGRNEERAAGLAKQRAEEYQQARSSSVPSTTDGTSTSQAVLPKVQKISHSSTIHAATTPFQYRPAAALALSLLITAAVAYASTDLGMPQLIEKTDAYMLALAAPAPSTIIADAQFRATDGIVNATELHATPTPYATMASTTGIPNVATMLAYGTTRATDANALRALRDGTYATNVAHANASSANVASGAGAGAMTAIVQAAQHPDAAVVAFYASAPDASAAILDGYAQAVGATGDGALAIGVRTRDALPGAGSAAGTASDRILGAYSTGVYAWVNASPEVAQATAQGTLAIGTQLAGRTQAVATLAPSPIHSDRIRAGAVDMALGVAGHIALAYDNLSAPITSQDAGGNSLVALAYQAAPWFVSQPTYNIGREIAVDTYDMFSRVLGTGAHYIGIALGLTGIEDVPVHTTVTGGNAAITVNATTTAPVLSGTTTGTVTYVGGAVTRPVTYVTNITNTYATPADDVVTKAFLDTALDSMNTRLGRSISEHSSGSSSGGPVDADNLTAVTLTVSGDASVGGMLTTGSVTSAGEVIGSYFTATTVSATSTLPKIITNSFSIGNDYVTDLTGDGLLVVNGALSVDPAFAGGVSTSTIASGFFAQGGNSFNAEANLGTNDANALSFKTNGITRATITTAGNFGIGSTSPASKLAVAGSAVFTGNVLATNLNATGTLAVGAVGSSLVPTAPMTYDVGSPTKYLRNGYFDTLYVNNFSISSSSVSGTATDLFTINSDNASADAEDSSLAFSRGTAGTDATLGWNAGGQRFEFNQAAYAPSFTTDTLAVSGDSLVQGDATVQGNQDVDGTITAGSVKIGALNGLLTAANGVIGTATAGIDYENPLSFASPLARVGDSVSLQQASAVHDGYLSSADWSLFNSKFGTTSAAYFLSVNQGAAFSTTSANYFLAQNGGGASFSTTSASYWLTTKTTDNLAQGTTNKYYSDTLARNAISNTATGLTYTASTGVLALTGGYAIPLAASTTEWGAFYSVPSSRITAGTNLSWAGNTLNGPSDAYLRGLVSATAPLAYDSTTGAFSIATSSFSGSGSHFNADLLDGLDSSYYLANAFSTTSAAYFLAQNGGGSSFSTTSANYFLTTKTTDNLAQGSTNKYYSDTLARAAISTNATGLTYTAASGVLSLTAGYNIPLTASTTNWNAAYDLVNAGHANWDTAYANRITSVTTTGTSGAATLTGNVLNIPQYAGTTYTATYPVTLTGSAIGLAFGTTTANSWSQLQTFDGGAAVNGTIALNATHGVTLSSGQAPAFPQDLTIRGTDPNTVTVLRVMPNGTPSSTLIPASFEFFGTDFLSSQTSFERFSIRAKTSSTVGFGLITDSAGTGVRRPIYIDASAGTNQLFLNTNGNVGIGSSTPGSIFAIGSTNGINFSTATTTFSSTGGINLANGCFAINGVCIGAGASGVTAATYPLQISGPTISLAFGTTTANTWSALQTFTSGVNVLSNLGSYKMDGQLLGYASSTNADTIFGLNAGGNSATTSVSAGSGYNSVFGYQALSADGFGSYNAAFGALALQLNSAGNDNTATGYSTLQSNTIGSHNTAYGAVAMPSNTTGNDNTAIGSSAQQFLTTGNSNTALGSNAGTGSFLGNTGSYNIAIGYRSGTSNTSGSDNTILGNFGGYNITTGNNNVLIGESSSTASKGQVTTGSGNVALGFDIAVPSPTANNQLSIGNLIYGTGLDGRGSVMSTGNIGIATTTPGSLFAIGGIANFTAATSSFYGSGGMNLTSGCYAVNGVCIGGGGGGVTTADYPLQITGSNIALAFGTTTANTWSALQTFTAGTNVSQFSGYYQNGRLLGYASSTNAATIFGIGAGGQNATTSATFANTTAIGNNALNALTTGGQNTALGSSAGLALTTGTYNTALGWSTILRNTTGSRNTAIGGQSQLGSFSGNIGNDNVSVGYQSLENLSSASFNTGIGNLALEFVSAGVYNTGLGYKAGASITTGYGNTILGSSPDTFLQISTGVNNIGIGTDAMFPSITGSNQLSIGNFIFGTMPATTSAQSLVLPTTGTFGIGSTTPFAKLSIQTNNGDTAGTLFAIGSSTASATSTLFSISNTGVLTSNALATSSFASGLNLTSGCYAVNGVCVGAGGGGVSLSVANTWTALQTFDAGVSVGQYAGYYQNGALLGYASSTNHATIFGLNAGGTNATTSTSAAGTTAVGNFALSSLTTGGQDTALGYRTLQSNTTGSFNTGVGISALSSLTTGNFNTALGFQAATGQTLGSENVAIGRNAAYGAGGFSYSASRNTAVGSTAGTALSNGGDDNAFFGFGAGSSIGTGFANIMIGSSPITGNLTSGSGNIGIGNDTFFPSATGNNQLNIGGLIFGTLPATSTAFRLPTSGAIGIGSSSPYAKLSIQANAGDTMGTLFAIGSSTATATTTLLSVLNNGNVGIGSAAPWAALAVSSYNGAKVAYGDPNSNLTFSLSTSTTATPSYTNPGGSGNRLAIVGVNTDLTVTSGGHAGVNNNTSRLLNGDTSSNGWYFNIQAATGHYIAFDFGAGARQKITEAKFYEQSATAQGTWQWQGSNDNSTWTSIGSTFTLGSSATQTITTLSGNTNYYRYYRILGVSGTTSDGPWVYQFEFKIANTNATANQQIYATDGLTAAGTVLAFQPNGGAVSIGGEAAPLSTLTVRGNATIGDSTFSPVFAPTNGLMVQGALYVGAQLPIAQYPNAKLIVDGGSVVSNEGYWSLNEGPQAMTMYSRGVLTWSSTFVAGDAADTGIGRNSAGVVEIDNGTGGTLATLVAANIGIGTTTPGSLFSVQGVANLTAATSTFYSAGGINLTGGGCFAVNGVCVGAGGGGVSLSVANTWSALQTFSAGASTTALSVTGTATSTFNGNISITGSILPTADNTYSLGSNTLRWKDLYVGPGSIYVNGQEVLHTDPSNNVNVSADANQNLVMQTSGSGNIELNPSGTGQLLLKGNVNFTGGKAFVSTDGSAIGFTSGITAGNLKLTDNTLQATNVNGSIIIAATGTGAIALSGNVGIGSTSPNSLLSIGSSNGINFSTATSTFNSTGGINLANGGCFAINGTCITAGGGSGASLSVANAWSALQTFSAGASTTALSVTGTATSTFGGNIALGTSGNTISTAATELVLQETGDSQGTTALHLQNRFASNGIVLDVPSQSVADFSFRTNSGTSVQNAIRMSNGTPFNASNTGGEFSFHDKSGTSWFYSGQAATGIITGNFGIGTTSPYAKLSVAGQVVAASFVGTTTATSTLGGGLNIASGCFAINGTCIGAGGTNYFTNSGASTYLSTGTKLGIGVSSPATALSILDTATTVASGISLTSTATGVDGAARITVTNNLGNAGQLFKTGSGYNPYKVIGTQDLGFYNSGAGNISLLNDASTGSIRFATGGASSAQLILDSTGSVGIGTVSPTAQLSTTGTVRFANFGAGTLSTDASGNLTVSSDERLKDVNGTFDRGLADLQQLDPILYHWNALSGYDRTTQYAGFSAQNVQSVIPEAVDTDSRGYLTLNDRPILAVAVNAIKELATRTDTLSMATTSLSVRLGNVENDVEVQKAADEAAAAVPHALSATTIDAQAGDFDGEVAATAFTVPGAAMSYLIGTTTVSVTLPDSVLAAGGSVDLYKLATYDLAQISVLSGRIDTIGMKVDSLEERLAQLETNGSILPADLFATSTAQSMLASVGFAFQNQLASIKALIAERLTVGTPQKPTGITIYDQATGDPYCVGVKNGQQVITPGECTPVDLDTLQQQQEEQEQQQQQDNDASTTPVTPAGDDSTASTTDSGASGGSGGDDSQQAPADDGTTPPADAGQPTAPVNDPTQQFAGDSDDGSDSSPSTDAPSTPSAPDASPVAPSAPDGGAGGSAQVATAP